MITLDRFHSTYVYQSDIVKTCSSIFGSYVYTRLAVRLATPDYVKVRTYITGRVEIYTLQKQVQVCITDTYTCITSCGH